MASATSDYTYISLVTSNTVPPPGNNGVVIAKPLEYQVGGIREPIISRGADAFTMSLIRCRIPLFLAPILSQPEDTSVNRWWVGFSVSAQDDALVDNHGASEGLYAETVEFLPQKGVTNDDTLPDRAYFTVKHIVAAINRALATVWRRCVDDPNFVAVTFLEGIADEAVLNRVRANPPFLQLVDGSSSFSIVLPKYNHIVTTAPGPPAVTEEVNYTLPWYSISPSGFDLAQIIQAAFPTLPLPPTITRHNINIVVSESLARTVFAQFSLQKFVPREVAVPVVSAPGATPIFVPLYRVCMNLQETTLFQSVDLMSNQPSWYYRAVSDSPSLQNLSDIVKLYLTLEGFPIISDQVSDTTRDGSVSGKAILTDLALALDPQVGRQSVYLSPSATTRQINLPTGVSTIRNMTIRAYYQILTEDGIKSYPLLLPPGEFSELRLQFTRQLNPSMLRFTG